MLPLAFPLALVIALLAWRAGSITLPGAFAAACVGTSVLLGAGWSGGAVLLAFFVSSTIVSRLNPNRGAEALGAKGERRDVWQVLANGGAAGLGALLEFSFPGAGLWVVTASLSAATADTWATSGGARSGRRPRDIVSWKLVPAGISGGITLPGCIWATVGAGLVGSTAAIGGRTPRLLPVALVIGFLGMLADSLIGATWQGQFHCPVCDRPSEVRAHMCGSATTLRRGLRWLTNDGVNTSATFLAAFAGLAAWWFFR